MKNLLLSKLLGFVGRKLDGYKTKVGGVGLVLVGLIGIVALVFPDQGLPQMELETALTTIASGFAVLGIGGKAEKLKGAIEASAPVPVELTAVVDSRDVQRGTPE
jgi:hypothetical protein